MHLICKECEKILNEINVDIILPRITPRQKRQNLLLSNILVDYYKVNTYIPLLDNLLEDLNLRFLSKENIVSIMQFLPSYIIKIKKEDLHNYFSIIFEIL